MLSQHFPTSGLKWLSEKEIEKTDLVIFHNLRGYDSHFSMQEIGEIAKNTHTRIKKVKIIKWTLMLIQTTWKNTWLLCWARFDFSS